MDLSTSQLARQVNYRARCVRALPCLSPRELAGSHNAWAWGVPVPSEAVRRVPCFLYTVGFLNTFLVLTRTESDEK